MWRRYLLGWLAFVAFGLAAGWHLKPRLDEVAVVLVLPLAVLVPYVLGCLVLTILRLLWPARNANVEPPLRVDIVGAAGHARLGSHNRLGKHART